MHNNMKLHVKEVTLGWTNVSYTIIGWMYRFLKYMLFKFLKSATMYHINNFNKCYNLNNNFYNLLFNNCRQL